MNLIRIPLFYLGIVLVVLGIALPFILLETDPVVPKVIGIQKGTPIYKCSLGNTNWGESGPYCTDFELQAAILASLPGALLVALGGGLAFYSLTTKEED